MCNGGGVLFLPPGDPAEDLAGVRKRLMLDVSYARRPLVGSAGDTMAGGPLPGERFPARHSLSGTGHHLIVFGAAPRLGHLRARWGQLVSILDAASAQFDATEAGVPNGGAILVRPDGFIEFRAIPPTRERWMRLTLSWRLISCPNSARARTLRSAISVRLTGHDFGNPASPGGITAVNPSRDG